MRSLPCRFLPLGLLALVLASAPGCTLIGAAVGGGVAAHSSHEADLEHVRRGEPVEERSIVPGVLAGATVGLIVDALVVSMALSSLETSSDTWSGTWGYGVSND